jgi:hypothetical protein
VKKIIATASALALVCSALYAGGPVIIEEDEVVEEQAGSSAWVPLLLLAVIGLAVASGDNDDPRICR